MRLWSEVLMRSNQSPIALHTITSIALLAVGCGNAAPDSAVARQHEGVTAPAACRIDYSKIDWNGGGGFRADIDFTNVGGTNYDGWSLVWSFGGDQRITAAWNGVTTQTDATVKVTPDEWNATLAPGERASIVLVGTATTPSTIPSLFSVNGMACSGSATPPPSDPPVSPPPPPSDPPTSPPPPPPPPSDPPSSPPPPPPPTGTTTAWRPFNAASPWNTPIDAGATVDANSAALVADFAQSSQWPFFTINIETYSVPVYFADAGIPMQTVTATAVGGQGFETGSAQVPIPAGAAPAAGTDQHLSIVNRQTNQEWGMWAASQGPSGWSCAVCATADLSGTGVRPPTENPPWWMGHGARACGFPLVAGLITVDEVREGSIEHALAIAYPHIRSRYYTPPASTAQSTTDQALGTRGVPCGGRIQLDPALDLNALGLSASGKIVARALQKYGAYVGDFSGAVSLYADASPTAQAVWKTGLLSTYEIKDQINLNKFRVLEIGHLYDNNN
jgi:hypothetical protein